MGYERMRNKVRATRTNFQAAAPPREEVRYQAIQDGDDQRDGESNCPCAFDLPEWGDIDRQGTVGKVMPRTTRQSGVPRHAASRFR